MALAKMGFGLNGIGRNRSWPKWHWPNGYWPNWELDQVALDEMALDVMGLDEVAIAYRDLKKTVKDCIMCCIPRGCIQLNMNPITN